MNFGFGPVECCKCSSCMGGEGTPLVFWGTVISPNSALALSGFPEFWGNKNPQGRFQATKSYISTTLFQKQKKNAVFASVTEPQTCFFWLDICCSSTGSSKLELRKKSPVAIQAAERLQSRLFSSRRGWFAAPPAGARRGSSIATFPLILGSPRVRE